jgi:hypothetical protein
MNVLISTYQFAKETKEDHTAHAHIVKLYIDSVRWQLGRSFGRFNSFVYQIEWNSASLRQSVQMIE